MENVATDDLTIIQEKRCTRCKLLHPLESFRLHPKGADGRHPWCKPCHAEVAKEWRKNNPERTKKLNAEYRLRERRDAMEAYGGRCACCEEDRFFFLTLDHVNGDGASDRRDRNAGSCYTMFTQLRKEGYPKDGRYQILCYNCNMAKRTSSDCPCGGRKPTRPQIYGQMSLF